MEKDIITQYEQAAAELTALLAPLGQDELNSIPFEGSWTAAQLASHLTQSNRYMVQALNMDANAIDGNPAERVEELRSIFLDFNTKLKSPDFILPAAGLYNKEKVNTELRQSIDNLLQASKQVALNGAIQHPVFGDITKLELLHFVVFHTQRHIHQLKNILRVVVAGKIYSND